MSLWTRFKKLFWNPPVEPDRPGIWGNTVDGVGPAIFEISCGFLCWGGKTNYRYVCNKPSCARCGAMTPERAAQINERFLKERTLVRVEAQIEKDCFIQAITEVQRDKYLVIVRFLDKARNTSTYATASQLKEACTFVRHRLQAMEKLGYVSYDSEGPDNIYWSLRP